MSKHTPGPWVFEICEESGDDFHLHAGEVVIIGGCGCCGSPYVAGDDHLANARLIAAAPELLKALIDILPLADFGASEQSPPYADDHLLLAAQAAIAKATGGSHE